MIYRFGAFELDESVRELRKDGVRVETEPKAFELLAYLVRHRDRAVSKDELLNEIWPRQIVTETALSRCVMKARRAVDGDSGAESMIRTLHGHGYRFVAEAEAGPARLKESGPVAASEGPAQTRNLVRRGVIVVVLAAIALAAAWFLWPEPAPAPAGTLAVLPVTNQVSDEDLGWVRVGLMSLLARMLEEGGIDVAEEHRVLSAVADSDLTAPPGPELIEEIRREAGAETVLHTVLDRQGGLHRLTATLTHPDGRRTRRLIVGASPAAVAADIAGVITGLLSSDKVVRPERFSKVSTDPFVNELYARALDLELAGELAEARELFRYAASQEPELFWLRYEIALCTRDLREWDEAEALFGALHDEAAAGDDLRARIVTSNSHGILKLNRNEYQAAKALFEQALALAEAQDEASERISPLINLALVSARQGLPGEARDYYLRVEHAYQEAGQEPGPFFNNNFAGLLAQLGDLDAARSHSEAAIAGFRLRGQRRNEAPALNRLAKILLRQGDIEGAVAHHEQALVIYRDLDDVVGELGVLLSLTSVYRANGDLTRARINVDMVIERAGEHDSELVTGDAYVHSGQVALDLQDHDAAMRAFETARSIFEGIGDDSGFMAACSGIVLTAIELGDLERARSLAGQMLETGLQQNHAVAAARAQWLLGRVARAEGGIEAAEDYFGAALAYAREHSDTRVLSDVAASLADLELERGNPEAAAALVEEARPHVGTERDFLRLEARLAVAQGDSERARALLTELRSRAGEAWTAEDEALIMSLVQ